MVEFTKDAMSACVLSSLGRETTALVRLDVETGDLIEEIASSDKCNVGGILIDEDSKEVQAVAFNYARLERRFFDKEMEADFAKLEAAAPPGAEVSVGSRTRDRATWVINYRRDDGPTE